MIINRAVYNLVEKRRNTTKAGDNPGLLHACAATIAFYFVFRRRSRSNTVAKMKESQSRIAKSPSVEGLLYINAIYFRSIIGYAYNGDKRCDHVIARILAVEKGLFCAYVDIPFTKENKQGMNVSKPVVVAVCHIFSPFFGSGRKMKHIYYITIYQKIARGFLR